jgi:hypothetical protein
MSNGKNRQAVENIPSRSRQSYMCERSREKKKIKHHVCVCVSLTSTQYKARPVLHTDIYSRRARQTPDEKKKARVYYVSLRRRRHPVPLPPLPPTCSASGGWGRGRAKSRKGSHLFGFRVSPATTRLGWLFGLAYDGRARALCPCSRICAIRRRVFELNDSRIRMVG